MRQLVREDGIDFVVAEVQDRAGHDESSSCADALQRQSVGEGSIDYMYRWGDSQAEDEAEGIEPLMEFGRFLRWERRCPKKCQDEVARYKDPADEHASY